jgi:hypothetical protein
MTVFVWIIRVALALLAVSGGAYKIFSFEELAKMPATAAFTQSVWATLGAFEILCGVLLLVPAKWKPRIGFLAAVALGLESVVLACVYARYSISLTATNPLVWVVAMALMAVFVAYALRSRA